VPQKSTREGKKKKASFAGDGGIKICLTEKGMGTCRKGIYMTNTQRKREGEHEKSLNGSLKRGKEKLVRAKGRMSC